jgi:phage regulator Rha-like protein
MLPITQALTMTSREIAELTGKRHDNVLRDIKNMITQLYDLQDNINLYDLKIQGVIIYL